MSFENYFLFSFYFLKLEIDNNVKQYYEFLNVFLFLNIENIFFLITPSNVLLEYVPSKMELNFYLVLEKLASTCSCQTELKDVAHWTCLILL